MVGVEEGREFCFRGDLYSQESTFPLVYYVCVCVRACVRVCVCVLLENVFGEQVKKRTEQTNSPHMCGDAG